MEPHPVTGRRTKGGGKTGERYGRTTPIARMEDSGTGTSSITAPPRGRRNAKVFRGKDDLRLARNEGAAALFQKTGSLKQQRMICIATRTAPRGRTSANRSCGCRPSGKSRRWDETPRRAPKRRKTALKQKTGRLPSGRAAVSFLRFFGGTVGVRRAKKRFFPRDVLFFWARIPYDRDRRRAAHRRAPAANALGRDVVSIDQQKIGQYLRACRKEQGWTQEQLAERLGVTNRSVSRWETGANLPELDLLIQLAELYGVELREILNGEKERSDMNQEMEETVRGVAEYSNYEKARLTRRFHWLFLGAIAAFVLYCVLEAQGLADGGVTEKIADVSLGFVLGMLLVGFLFTGPLGLRLRQFKQKLLRRDGR